MIYLLGAGGFIGSAIAKSLNQSSAAFATVSRSFQWSQLSNEVRYIDSISFFAEGANVLVDGDVVVYMAGSTNLAFAENDPARDLCGHILEIESFFARIRSLKLVLGRFIFVSSAGTVYGDCNGIKVKEDTPLCPISVYGRRNALLESFVEVSASSIAENFCIFRVSNPFGPYQYSFRRKGLVQVLLNSALTGEQVDLRGGGYQVRDYIYSDDLAFIFCTLFQIKNISGCINISSGFSYSAREVVSILSKQGYIPNINYVFEESSYEVKDSLVDNSKLCQVISIDSSILAPFAPSRILEMVSVM